MAKESKTTLLKKLHTVWAQELTVPKSGFNKFSNYKYSTEADIIETVKKPFVDAGLMATFDVVNAEMTVRSYQKTSNQGIITEAMNACHVVMAITVMDPDSGESLEPIHAHGFAEDKGDKALYKAITGAVKYFWMKNFGLASEDDPENETEKTNATWNNMNPVSQPARQPKQPPAIPPEAQAITKEIMGLMTQYSITKEQFTALTGLETLQGMAVSTLEAAYNALKNHLERAA